MDKKSKNRIRIGTVHKLLSALRCTQIEFTEGWFVLAQCEPCEPSSFESEIADD